METKGKELLKKLSDIAKDADLGCFLMGDIDGTIIGVVIGEPEVCDYLKELLIADDGEEIH